MKRKTALAIIFGLSLGILSGCYEGSADLQDTTIDSRIEVLSDDGAIPLYDVPQENLQAKTMQTLAPAFFVDEFYIASGEVFRVYDMEAKTSYVPCYQTGCNHSDTSCPVNFGGTIMYFAEYKGKYYASTEHDAGAAYEFVCRDVSGGELQVLGRWESEMPEKAVQMFLKCISHDAAYLIVNTDYYRQNEETGVIEPQESAVEILRYDLTSGEISEVPQTVGGRIYGIWEDRFVVAWGELKADAPSYEEYISNGGNGTDYYYTYYDYTIEEYDLVAGKSRIIAEKTTATADPKMSWGQFVIYRKGNTLYVYDMEAQETKEVYSNQNLINFFILDGRAFAIVMEGDLCRVFVTDIFTGQTLEVDNQENDIMVFSPHYESDTVFCGYYKNGEYYISKEDFYNGNYEACFR